MKQMYLRWLLRGFGILDIPQIIKTETKKKKKTRRKNAEHWGKITVSDDYQVERNIEPMEGGTQSCPYWYSTRLFHGREISPGVGRPQEYWCGIRCTFLAPIIPIPICSDEKVFKLGDSRWAYDDAYNKYGRSYMLLTHREEYAHMVIEEADVEFVKADVSYDNDEIWDVH